MKQKDITILVTVGILAAVISAIIAGKVFNAPKTRSTKVPVYQAISGTFPDAYNDAQYNTIFNQNALDPTQLIKIGTSQNQQPFNGQ